MRIISGSVDDTLRLGKKIAGNLKAGDIVCLFGQLGTGKTILTKGIACGLGIPQDNIVSPTFVLIRQYESSRLPLYHFDFYRLGLSKEIMSLGYEEYLYGSGISVIEWADRLGDLLPDECLMIKLSILKDKKRIFNFSARGRRYKELLRGIYEDIRH